jgi:hypothetical protein
MALRKFHVFTMQLLKYRTSWNWQICQYCSGPIPIRLTYLTTPVPFRLKSNFNPILLQYFCSKWCAVNDVYPPCFVPYIPDFSLPILISSILKKKYISTFWLQKELSIKKVFVLKNFNDYEDKQFILKINFGPNQTRLESCFVFIISIRN